MRYIVIVNYPEPLVGSVPVAGIEASSAQEAVQQARIRKQWPAGCTYAPRLVESNVSERRVRFRFGAELLSAHSNFGSL